MRQRGCGGPALDAQRALVHREIRVTGNGGLVAPGDPVPGDRTPVPCNRNPHAALERAVRAMRGGGARWWCRIVGSGLPHGLIRASKLVSTVQDRQGVLRVRCETVTFRLPFDELVITAELMLCYRRLMAPPGWGIPDQQRGAANYRASRLTKYITIRDNNA